MRSATRSLDRRRGRVAAFATLRVAFDSAGAFPGVQFLGVVFVEVAEDRVQDIDLGIDGGEFAADEGGVFGAFLHFGGVVFVELVEQVAVVAQVGDEGGVDRQFEEAGAKGGFGEFLLGGVTAIGDGGVVVFQEGEQAVGVGADVFLDAGWHVVEGNGKSDFFATEFDAARGAGDGFEVEEVRVEHARFGDEVGRLPGDGAADDFAAGFNLIDMFLNDKDEAMVVDVVVSEEGNVISTVGAAGVSVVHSVFGF